MRSPLFLLATALIATMPPALAQVGDIEFETSATSAAQRHFLRGVAILHSFGFEDAIDEFRKAQEIEPGFALAYWGEAMAHNSNPLVSPTRQDLPAARRALARLAPARSERIAMAKTKREKMWMRAVEALYGAGDKETRDRTYASEMAKIVESYPEDDEARAFYALALLGTVKRAGEDFTQQMRGAAVAQALFRDNPRHPGAAHYIIHAFDDPVHAPLALYAADRYAEIAPDVEHALHMPSHIFVQLGLWEKVVRSNERAYQASVTWAADRGLSETKRDFHALSWMQYGRLQRGEFAAARAAIEAIRPVAEREVTTSVIQATYANMTARYLIETGDWDAFSIPLDALLANRHAGDVFLLLAAGMRAVIAEDLETAERVEARLRALEGQDSTGLKSALQGQVTLEDLKTSASVAAREMGALLRLARGETDAALGLVAEAVETEKEMHPAYGPPEPMVPPLELQGYLLLKAGRHGEAAAAFEEMLSRMPNRTQSLLGAARAAVARDDDETARKHYTALVAIWSASEPTPSLAEARGYLDASGE